MIFRLTERFDYMKKQASLFGGAMIIAGTIVGAGMLANPTATSGIWFIGSLLVLVYTWICMLGFIG